MVGAPGVTGRHPNGVIHPPRVTTAHPAGRHRRPRSRRQGGAIGAAIGDVLGLASGHDAAVMAVLFLVFGCKLVGDGIAVLS